MKIGIDISQLAYKGTGVANYIENLVESLLAIDNENEYILFFSSLRLRNSKFKDQKYNTKVTVKEYRFPPSFLDLLWNRLHIFPIEWLIGPVDIFLTSDWTEPPTIKAQKMTILYDLVVYKFPEETDKKIVDTQKRKLQWVKKESKAIFCISEATKNDAKTILKIPNEKLFVTYPGFSL